MVPAGIEPPNRASFILSYRPAWVLAWVLGVLFGLWSLVGVEYGNTVDTDAARHAMNGAFVHDLVRDMAIAHPIAYGKRYYSRMPALSLPFHPPLFPAVEAVFFSIFGVNLLAARLAVALAVALSAVLLYRLVVGAGFGAAVGFAAMFTVITWGWSERVARDVMLEFPALVFTLAALYCLRELDKSYPLRRGLLFAALAGAAVWTKQQTVFLGLVPFCCILLTRSWSRLKEKTIWVSSLLFGLLVMALAVLTLPFGGAGVDQAAKSTEAAWIFVRNLRYYVSVVPDDFGAVQCGLLVLAIVLAAVQARRPMPMSRALFMSWAATAFLVLLLIGPYSSRYLFFVFPAVVVLGYGALQSAAERALPARWVWAVPLLASALSSLSSIRMVAPFLRGPEEAARIIMSGASSRRVLYCGGTDGNFVFAIRSQQTKPLTVVIAGEKLPPSIFSREQFARFANRYGLEYIVLERGNGRLKQRAWEALMESPVPEMVPVRDIQLASSDRRWNGLLRVFRFTNPSPHPDNTLETSVQLMGSKMPLTF